MAKQWKNFGKKLDDAAKDALLDSGIDFRGLGSDEERIDSALSVLSSLPLWDKERYDDLRVMKARRDRSTKDGDKFDIENAAKIIDTWSPRKEGKKNLSIGDQFYNDYWKADKKTRSFWKTAIEDTLGEGAWDEVKLRLNNRLKDEAAAQADKERRDIIEGNAEGQGIGDWLASAVGGLMLPRTKEKALEGKEVEGKDIALDAAETLAMTLPMAPATILGKIGAAAAVPLASEIMDAIAYDTSNQNDIADRADFNPVDVGVGAAINAVAPVAMQKAMKRIINGFGAKSGQGASKEIMGVLEDMRDKGTWSPVTKERYPVINSQRYEEAAKLQHDALLPHKQAAGYMTTTEQLDEAVNKLAATHDLIEKAEQDGNKKLKKAMTDQLRENIGDDDILNKAYKSAEESYKLEKGAPLDEDSPTFREFLETTLSQYDEQASKKVRKAAEGAENLTIDQKTQLLRADELKKLADETAEAGRRNRDKFYKKNGGVENYLKNHDVLDLPNFLPDNFTPAEKLAAGMSDNLDNIIAVRNSGASKLDKWSLEHPKASALLGGLGESASTFVANKTGNQGNVERAVSPVESFLGKPGMLSKPLRKLQTEQREEARKAQSKAVLDSIANSAEDAEDRKWLGVIAKNPDLVKGVGAEALDPKFRKWMLVRGSDILRGTDLYRPTFEVE